jgi:nucleotide-binding universal stress UspA family protein
MVSSILVAVDGSPAAESALTWAAELVAHEHEKGNVVAAALVNIYEPHDRSGIEGFGMLQSHEELRQANALLDRMVENEPGAESFERLVDTGAPADAVLEEARDRNADLIVVGTRHQGAVRQSLLGSVSQQIAAERERPVAVVPAGSTTVNELSVVGYDGSAGARAAIRWALENLAGEVRVVRVVATPDEVIEARESIAALLPALGPIAAGRVIAEVVVGEPIDVLMHRDRETPQIIVGARSDKDRAEGIWGSTTTHLLAETNRPVIVVPPEPWD